MCTLNYVHIKIVLSAPQHTMSIAREYTRRSTLKG